MVENNFYEEYLKEYHNIFQVKAKYKAKLKEYNGSKYKIN